LKLWIKATDWRELTSADAARVELKINWNLATDSQKKMKGDNLQKLIMALTGYL
jgi:hypothetical protein